MRRVKRVWGQSITNKIAIILLIAFLIAVVGGYTGSWYFSWTGLADYTRPPGVDERGKTLWAWLELLIIPAVLAGGAMWFSRAEREADRRIADERSKAERKIANERSKAEREIADDRLRETALQTYLDRMTDLLLERELRTSKEEDEVRAVARARTLTTLRQLDGTRKGTLLRFLYEAELINRDNAVIQLHTADLSGAYLSWANLSKADLSKADLNGADLSVANLSKAKLSWAELREANLHGADLSGAYLGMADLSEADLSEADLSGANLTRARLGRASLSEADLSGARLFRADLSETNLSETNLVWADLAGADLSGADLSEANLSEIRYNDNTTWPDNFTPPTDPVLLTVRRTTTKE